MWESTGSHQDLAQRGRAEPSSGCHTNTLTGDLALSEDGTGCGLLFCEPYKEVQPVLPRNRIQTSAQPSVSSPPPPRDVWNIVCVVWQVESSYKLLNLFCVGEKKIQNPSPGLFMLKRKACSHCCWGMKRAYCSFKAHSIVFAAVKYFWKFTAVAEIPWSLSVSSLPVRELKGSGSGSKSDISVLHVWNVQQLRESILTGLELRRNGFVVPSYTVWETLHATLAPVPLPEPKMSIQKRARNAAQDSGLHMHFKQELSLIFNAWTALSDIRIPYKRRSMLKQIT